MDSDAVPGMKTPANQVAAAISMYYEGMSLNAIRRQLQQEYDYYPSDSTIYDWIVRYTREAVQKTKDCKPSVGDIWIVDGTELNIEGKTIWFGDIMDGRTRFFLASHMSSNLIIGDVETLIKKASDRADKTPKVVVSDKLSAYLKSIEPDFRIETKHSARQKTGITAKQSSYKQFYGSQKARNKVMRSLKKLESAQLLLDGWLAHYNFFRPNEAIKQLTPAEYAKTSCPFKRWLDIIRPPRTYDTIAPSIPKAPDSK